jgi:transposase InsO family protein
MKGMYAMCGISKQGHWDAVRRAEQEESKEPCYVGLMYEIRQIHPGMGLRSMYDQFNPEGIGRDAFIALGLREGFRLRTFKNPHRTTWSVKNTRYRNLLGNRRFTFVNQVWVSDIFYFSVENKHYYVVLIMDVYSRRIVGYSVADNLRAENNLKALAMALTLRGENNYEGQLIHHSDRGSQYISDDYTNMLDDYGIQISMCIDVLENAHCERVNGTIKNDYLSRWNIQTAEELMWKLPEAINNYNQRRHQTIKMTPIEFETYVKELEPVNRPQMEIFTVQQNVVNPFQLSMSLD